MKAILLWTMSPLLLLASLLNLSSEQPAARQSEEPSILVFSATRGFRHASIPDGIKAIGTIAAKNKWTMVATEDSSVFSPEKLGKFSAIVLLNTTGNVFGPKEEAALQQYVRAGGGVVGIHAAADCEYDWPWYNQLMG